jgi:hypothetical protein
VTHPAGGHYIDIFCQNQGKLSKKGETMTIFIDKPLIVSDLSRRFSNLLIIKTCRVASLAKQEMPPV